MHTTLSTVDTAPRHRSRATRRIADHPVAAQLIVMFTVSYALLVPPALAGLPLEPFLLGVVVLGQLLPAVLVTAAAGGRPAVKDLFARVFRWRLRPRWWLFALFAVPAASLLIVTAVFGTGAVRALVTDPAVVTGYLMQLTILPLVNLWEETAWTGVVQARLAATRGPLVAAAVVGPLFGLVHLPLHLGRPVGALVVTMALFMVLTTAVRIVIGRLYAVTGGSVLIAAVFHVTYNATQNQALLTAAAPGSPVLEYVAPIVVVVLAITVVLTRGRQASTGSDPDRVLCDGKRPGAGDVEAAPPHSS